MATKKRAAGKKKWSARVTQTSDALDVAGGTFAKDDPKAIARELERDAEKSSRRKSSPYRSAMSMLTFYINRAGKNLPAERKKILEDAKQMLREEFGPEKAATAPKRRAKAGAAKKAASKKTAGKKTAGKKTARKKKATSKKAVGKKTAGKTKPARKRA